MTVQLSDGAVSKFREWRQEQMATIKGKEDQLAAELSAAVPKELRKLFEEDVIIKDLLQYGIAGRKFHDNGADCSLFGYANLKQLAGRLRRLGADWKRIVKISMRWRGEDQLDVTFTAVAAGGGE